MFYTGGEVLALSLAFIHISYIYITNNQMLLAAKILIFHRKFNSNEQIGFCVLWVKGLI